MEPSIIHSQASAFEERNAFLYFVLGLVSLSHNFLDHLESEQDIQDQSHDPREDTPEGTLTTDLRDLLI
jgi:hypothetical protein